MIAVRFECVPSRSPIPSCAVTVGQDEQPLATVRSADFLRCEQTRRNSVAQSFQVANDILEAKRYVAGDVLEEAERRRDFFDDASHIGPEMAGIIRALATSGQAEGLAGVAASDEIHDSTPRAAIEGLEVVPDRSAIQGRFAHPRHEDGRAEGFPLDVTNSPGGRDGKLDSEVKSADSGAEREGT